jgi:hypothetical protein
MYARRKKLCEIFFQLMNKEGDERIFVYNVHRNNIYINFDISKLFFS